MNKITTPEPLQQDQIKNPSNEHENRLLKVKELEKAGINPWPSYKPVTATTQDVVKEFDEAKPLEYSLAGRLMTRRDHGKTYFAHIQDRAGLLQLYIKQDVVGEQAFQFFIHSIDIGDIIWVQGTPFKTKTGEITLKVTQVTLLSKCLFPLPEKFHGLTDVEQRYRQRYLDLISNPESREKFKQRSLIISQIRAFFEHHDFIEVETPVLHPIPGGAAARPFVTHHNAYDIDLYLRIAPELYLKRLVVGGLERVFEITRNFRNEGVSTRHNPEFTSVEYYMAHGSYLEGMQLTEDLFRAAAKTANPTMHITFHDKILDFEKPFARMTMVESLQKIGGLTAQEIAENSIDATMKKHGIEPHRVLCYPEKIYALFEALVEPKIIQPTFITEFPTAVSPLARRNEQNPEIVDRFELFMAGMELANGFSELNNPFDQAARFKEQVTARDAGDQEAHHYDADYVHALEYALPPTVGVGFGVDRLVMLLTNTASIKDVILFPTLKPSFTGTKEHEIKRAVAEKLIVEPSIFKTFPGTQLGVLVGFDLKNEGAEIPEIKNLLREVEDQIRTTFRAQTPAEHQLIKPWRNAYQTFGADPSKYLSSVENLSTRILAGSSLRHVNTLVDLYNYVSLKYLLPAGGEDIDHLDGNVILTFAGNKEIPVVAFGEKEAKSPTPGEVIYKDNGGTLCRRWNWRGTERSKLTAKTKNAYFVLEGLPPVKKDQMQQALDELAKLIAQYCGGTIETMIIDDKNQEASLEQKQKS